MRKTILIPLVLLTIFISFFHACSKDEGFNLFTLQQDIEFGMAMNEQILATPDEFPVLNSTEYAEAYWHLERIRDSILQSDLIRYKTEFPWEVYLIDNDSVLNAFAVPGGYMYFYTGIIHFLNAEDEFAGVMAHEMAHIDKRHSTQMLSRKYGFTFLLDILLGKSGENAYVQIASALATGLAGLEFSRKHEYEADEFAVRYMYPTAYDARGVKKFFDRLGDSQGPPTFLSTHPSPPDRVESIIKVWDGLNEKNNTVKEGQTFSASYKDFKNSLIKPVK